MVKKIKRADLIIEGNQIYLREVRLSDANRRYYKWMKDPEATQYLEARFEDWSIRKLKGYVKRTKNNPNNIFLAIISKVKGRHIGNIKLSIDKNHNFADVALFIGEKTFWGKGIATEAIGLVANYAFNKLNLHKLIAGAYADNIGSIKAFKKAGFIIEGRRKRQYCSKGRYVNAVQMARFRK